MQIKSVIDNIHYINFITFNFMLYRGKETMHSETELIIYLLKWYNPTSIINLSL